MFPVATLVKYKKRIPLNVTFDKDVKQLFSSVDNIFRYTDIAAVNTVLGYKKFDGEASVPADELDSIPLI